MTENVKIIRIIPGTLVMHESTGAIGNVVRLEHKKGHLYADVKYEDDFIICTNVDQLRKLARKEYVSFKLDKWLNEGLVGGLRGGRLVFAASIALFVYAFRVIDIATIATSFKGTLI